MLRRSRQIQTQLQQLLDACLFAAAFALAYLIRANEAVAELLRLGPPSPFEDYVWLFLIVIPAGPLLLGASGAYDRPLLAPRKTISWGLLKACAATTSGLILVVYTFHLTLARPVLLIFGLTSFGLVYAKEEIMRLVYQNRFAISQFRRRFMLVGTRAELARIRQDLQTRPEVGLEIVAELNLDVSPSQNLAQQLHDYAVNGVIISATHTFFDQVEGMIRACELEGVEAWLVADFFATQISRTSFDEFHGHPVLVFRSGPEISWQAVLKQVLDFTLALLAMVPFAFLYVAVAILIKRSSPGPVLFKQQRAGLNGSPFTMYKFRTMVTNAEQLKDELASLNEMTGPVFKITDDPRIIPIGRFLRKFSIDEFPQLINVLRGEMSLVGPRPLPLDEVRRFDDLGHRRRLSVKPGLTCLWQVSGRNEVCTFEEWVRLDLEYIDNWSLWLDIKILLRTVPAVIAGVGAK
jgi:exopolysaccharide biosynthesis polyprenyl glycosylphosphotransferase